MGPLPLRSPAEAGGAPLSSSLSRASRTRPDSPRPDRAVADRGANERATRQRAVDRRLLFLASRPSQAHLGEAGEASGGEASGGGASAGCRGPASVAYLCRVDYYAAEACSGNSSGGGGLEAAPLRVGPPSFEAGPSSGWRIWGRMDEIVCDTTQAVANRGIGCVCSDLKTKWMVDLALTLTLGIGCVSSDLKTKWMVDVAKGYRAAGVHDVRPARLEDDACAVQRAARALGFAALGLGPGARASRPLGQAAARAHPLAPREPRVGARLLHDLPRPLQDAHELVCKLVEEGPALRPPPPHGGLAPRRSPDCQGELTLTLALTQP